MQGISSEKLLDSLFDGVYVVDTQRRITFWNAAAERISGYSRAEVVGSWCGDNLLRHVDGRGCELCDEGCPLSATMGDGAARETTLFMHHRLGHRVPVSLRSTPLYDDQGKLVGAVEIFSDHSSALQILQEFERLKQDAFIDALTGIGNRRYAETTLASRLHDLETQGVPFGVLFLDLDHFKSVNDRFGHNTGDAVLAMAAKSVSAVLRKVDVAARWGGEEFVVILPGATEAAVKSVAERVRMLIETSFIMDGTRKLQVTVSVGATVARPDDTAASVIGRADRYMYRSKQTGRNRVTADDEGAGDLH